MTAQQGSKIEELERLRSMRDLLRFQLLRHRSRDWVRKHVPVSSGASA